MSSKSKYAILLISSVLVIYAIIGGMLGRVSAQNGSYQQLTIFTEVLSRLQNDYVDDPNIKSAVDGAIRGLVESVDPYGGYLTPKDVAFYKDYAANPQKIAGIGATLAKPARLGYPVIISTIPGGSATKAGLNSGDIIESIDGLTTRELNLVQINSLLAAPMGKPVALSVIRSRRADPEIVNVNREIVQAPPVEAKMLESNIAYVKVPYLAPGKAQETRRQLDGLLKKGASTVILDLRYTAGGDDKEALEIANLFIESGPLAYLGSTNSSQAQKKPREALNADPKQVLTKLPVAVLVNQGTAGPAELVAGAIEDSHRGQIVGVKTFGTGSIQKLIPLEDGYGLLISTAKYFTPSGKEIQDNEPQDSGIKPTLEIRQNVEEALDASDDPTDAPAPPKEKVKDEDRQLNKAIEILKDPSKISATNKAA
ncbi:MAG: peptidase S41 [Acidobacteria bacterium]|nr:MAG: peptidase S41 [Acidobacteriota bacterium]